MKKLLFYALCLCSFSVNAQDMFWTFNDEQQPMTIAPECDARFDPVQGGVFMPTTEEVYQQGVMFLSNQSAEIQRQAPYCFLVAAFGGNADAQFQLAQLYNKGNILPRDDLSAYKWAFIAALNGNKEAEEFTLALEPFLTTSDLEATNASIQAARLEIQENMQKQLQSLKPASDNAEGEAENKGAEKNGHYAPLPTSMTNIFTEKDRYK